MRTNVDRKSEGRAERAGGKIRSFFGRLFGSERATTQGRAQEMRGERREETAKAGERAQGKVQEIGGAIENRAGALIGDQQMQGEGRAKEREGEVRQDVNR